MSQIYGKFIGDNEIDDTKVDLRNDQSLRARNAADTGDVDILKVNTSDAVEHTNVGSISSPTISDPIDMNTNSVHVYGNPGSDELLLGQSGGDASPANFSVRTDDALSTDSSFGIEISSGSTVDGNSGNIILKAGTPSGSGTKGIVSLDANYIDANSTNIKNVTDPFDPQDVATKNYVDSTATGANTSLSNLTTTSINEDLNLNTGSDATIKTVDDAINDANPTKSLIIASGDKTDGTGDSGDITIKIGSSVGGSRGLLTLDSLQTDFLGTPHLLNNTFISARNFANSADINVTKVGTDNKVYFGNDSADGNGRVGQITTSQNTIQIGRGSSDYTSIFVHQSSSTIDLYTENFDGEIDLDAASVELLNIGDGSGATELRFWDGNNNSYVGFKAIATSISTPVIWTLPSVDGSSGDVLSTNGSGILSWTGNPSPTGLANTLAFYNSSGDLDSNASAKYNETTNSMAFGTEGTTGAITAITSGNFAHGHTDSSGATITVSGLGSQGFGGSINSGTIVSNSASLGFGFADGASIATGGIGAFAGGYSKNSSSILSDGHGCLAIGYAINSGTIHAGSADGAFAHGMAQNSSTIVASQKGSFASGFADSGGDILATNFGAAAIGYTLNSGTLTSSGFGSLAIGNVDGASSTITASGTGSFAGGYVPADAVTSSGTASFSWGLGHVNDNFHCVIFGRYSVTPPSAPGTWNATDPLFILGNGTSTSSRSNAFEVLKDGTVTIADSFTLPNVDGNAGQVLETDGAGVVSWTDLPIWEKEVFTLSAGDITNQYIDLANVALNDSIDFLVRGGGIQMEGASYDYTVSYTGGAGGNTRITFQNDLATGGASALIAGDIVVVKYQY